MGGCAISDYRAGNGMSMRKIRQPSVAGSIARANLLNISMASSGRYATM